MQHPDEGTVHAWLDGELPSAEASALEAHLQSCAECAAVVAEARGFIAASSRILGALDDVPANVAPTAKPPVETARPELGVVRGAGGRATPKLRFRPFYRNPQLVAAAALLVVAMGTWRVMEQRRTPAGDALVSAEQSGAPVTYMAPSAPIDSAGAALAAAPKAAVAEPPAASRAAASPRPAAEADLAARAPQVANAPVPAAPPAPAVLADQAERARREVASNEVVGAAAGGAQPARADSVRPAARAADAAEGKRLAVVPDSVTASEQRRLAGEVQAQRGIASKQALNLEAVVTASASAPVAAGGVAKARTATTLAGGQCYAIPMNTRTRELDLPEHLELLSMNGPVVEGRLWRPVRIRGESPEVGAWFWSSEAEGTLVLARIEGGVVRARVPVRGAGVRDARAVGEPCPR